MPTATPTLSSRDTCLTKWPRFLRLSTAERKVLQDGIWVAGGQMAAALGTLLGMRLLTEFVSPAVFGAVSLLLGLTLLGTNLFCTPLLQSITRFFPEMAQKGEVHRLRRSIRRPLCWTTLFLVALVLSGGGVYSLGRNTSFFVFVPLAALIAVDVTRNLEMNMLSAARRQRPCALWQVAEAWGRPAFAVVAVLVFGARAQTVLGGYLVASLVTLLVFRSSVRREGLDEAAASAADDKASFNEIRRYALPLMPLAIVSWVTSLSDRYVIGGILGLEQVGIYAAAVGLISRPFLMMGTVLLNTLRPVYFENVSSGNQSREQKALRSWTLSAVALFATGTLAVCLCSHFISTYLLAERYRSSAALLPYFALGYSLICLSQIYNTISLAYKRSWLVFASETSAACASILVGIPLTYVAGLKGAAAAVPVYAFVQLATAWWFSLRVRPKHEQISAGAPVPGAQWRAGEA